MQKKVMIEMSNSYCDICYANGIEKGSFSSHCCICKKDICHEHSKSHEGLRVESEYDSYYEKHKKGSKKKYCENCFKEFESLGKEIETLYKRLEKTELKIYLKENKLQRERK